MDTYKTMNAWFSAVERALAGRVHTLKTLDELPVPVRAESAGWCAQLFPAETDPHRVKKGVRIGVHIARPDTPDLVLWGVKAGEWELKIAESAAYVFVFVSEREPLVRLPQAERRKAVEAAAAMLHVPGVFRFPEEMEEGLRFSTNPQADALTLDGWKERVDGGIERGLLFFLFYKKPPERPGYRKTGDWFPDEFRAAVGEK